MKYSRVNEYGSVPKKKRRGLVIAVGLFLVVLVVMGGMFYYKLKYSRNSIQVLLDYTFDYLESSIEKSNYGSVTGNFSMQMRFQGADEVDNEIFNIFNKLNLSGDYGIDYNKSIMNLELYSDYDDKDLVDMSMYTEYGKAYVYLDGLYDKYIGTSVDNYSEIFERNLDDYKNVIVSLRKALNGSLKKEYFVVEKVTLDSVKVTKTTLDLTGNNYQEYNNSFIQILLNDKSFLESYSKITDKEIDEVKKEFNDMLEETKDYEGEKFVLYTKKGQFIKLDMIAEDDRLVIKENNDKYEYEFYENGVVIYAGSVKITVKDNKSTILFSYYDKEEDFGIEVTFDNLVKINGEVEKKDVTNSISSEKISDEDIMSIYNKLMENEGVVKIIEEVSKLSNQDVGSSSSAIVTS